MRGESESEIECIAGFCWMGMGILECNNRPFSVRTGVVEGADEVPLRSEQFPEQNLAICTISQPIMTRTAPPMSRKLVPCTSFTPVVGVYASQYHGVSALSFGLLHHGLVAFSFSLPAAYILLPLHARLTCPFHLSVNDI